MLRPLLIIKIKSYHINFLLPAQIHNIERSNRKMHFTGKLKVFEVCNINYTSSEKYAYFVKKMLEMQS